MAIRRSTLGAAAVVPVGGPAGLPGQSAYGAWLALGNTGTLADFLASLKGTSGASTVSALTDATTAFKALNTDAAGQRQAMGAASASDLLGVAQDTLTALSGKVDVGGAIDANTFTALGTGAVSRALALSVQDFAVNVKNYGAKGDNSSDDTAAVQKAVNFAATFPHGCQVFFPAGIYVISAAITVPASKAVSFRGHSMAASVIRQTNATADGIVFDNGTDYLTGGQMVSDLTIEAGAGFQAAGFFGAGSSGTGLKFNHGNFGAGTHNVGINNFATGLAILSCWGTIHINLRVQFHAGDAIYIDKGPDGSIGGDNRLIGFITSNNGFSADASNSHSLRIRSSGGDYFINADMVGAQTAVLIDPPAGTQVTYSFFDQVLADSSLADGWVFDASAGGIYAVRMNNCWAGSNNGNGMVTKGPNLHGLSSVNMALRESGQRGFWHKGGTGIDFVNPDISVNSRLSPGTYPGVEIADGAGGFSIIGGRNGNQDSSATSQAESVKFDGASSDLRISLHDMTNTGAGKAYIAFDETKITNFTLSGNLPRFSYGVNLSERQAVIAADFIGASASPTYLGIRGAVSSPNLLPFSASVPALISRVDVQIGTPPGAGQSFTYQIVKNGTPVGATLTISDTSTYTGLFYPGVTVAPNDNYEVKMTPSSASAAGGIHRALISLDR